MEKESITPAVWVHCVHCQGILEEDSIKHQGRLSQNSAQVSQNTREENYSLNLLTYFSLSVFLRS